MARKLPVIKLSSLSAGIHSTESVPNGQTKLSDDRCVRALNVEEDRGYLKRRPAFKSIAHGPQFVFPTGQTVVHYTTHAGTPTDSYIRTFAVYGSDLANANTYVYVGCDNQFDGIYIPKISLSAATVSANRSIKVEFSVDATTWDEFYNPIDFTVGRNTNSGDVYYHTLTQAGTISWHRLITDNEFNLAGARTWTSCAPTGLTDTKYWVRLSLVDRGESPAVTDSLGGAYITCSLPGVLPFQLDAVNSIIPARSKNGKSTIFFCGDRQNLRGKELGAAVSAWTQLDKSPKLGFKVEDEGAGVYDLPENAAPANWYGTNTSTGNRAWNTTGWTAADATGSWTIASPSGSLGHVGRFTKSDNSYNWLSAGSASADTPYCQFRGAQIYSNISPSAVCTNDTTQSRTTIPVSLTNLSANALEHCFIRVVDPGSSGITIGEERIIISNTASSLICHPNFSATPSSDTTFHIYKPHSKARFSKDASEWVIAYNYYDSFINESGVGDISDLSHSTLTEGEWTHFYLGRELQWVTPRNSFWTSCYDTITQTHLLTNGKSGILSYDGVNFREVVTMNDPTNPRVQQFLLTAGAFDNFQEQVDVTSRLESTALRNKVPSGQFLVTFNGRLVIADQKTVYWSLPGISNDIWPNSYEQQIREPFNNEITGMVSLGDRLIVFTPTSIHSSPPADDQGFFNFQLESSGIGFLSHRAVGMFYFDGSPALIGPTADGIRIYSPGSASPTPIIDNWSQIYPAGINTGLLRNSVGCLSKLQNRYYIAVPRAGFTTCDTILVFDFATKAWYVWKFPYGGVSSISRNYDEAGNEQILFGALDGTVSVLCEKEYDDGDNSNGVNWYAISPPIEFNGSTVAPTAIIGRFDDIDPNNTVTLSTYINGRIDTDDTSNITITDSAAIYGTGTYGTSTYASDGDVSTKVNLPTGTRCERFQFGLSGTKRFRFKGAELLATTKGQRSK